MKVPGVLPYLKELALNFCLAGQGRMLKTAKQRCPNHISLKRILAAKQRRLSGISYLLSVQASALCRYSQFRLTWEDSNLLALAMTALQNYELHFGKLMTPSSTEHFLWLPGDGLSAKLQEAHINCSRSAHSQNDKSEANKVVGGIFIVVFSTWRQACVVFPLPLQ